MSHIGIDSSVIIINHSSFVVILPQISCGFLFSVTFHEDLLR